MTYREYFKKRKCGQSAGVPKWTSKCILGRVWKALQVSARLPEGEEAYLLIKDLHGIKTPLQLTLSTIKLGYQESLQLTQLGLIKR